VNAPVRRRPNGTLLPGNTANAGGRPRSLTDALKQQYRNRLPELMDGLFLLTKSDNPHVCIAATVELLNRLIGRPSVMIDTVTEKFDFRTAYLQALQRVNSRVVEGKAGTVGQTPDGAASDRAENKSDPTK
jgi:hypothetical protein